MLNSAPKSISTGQTDIERHNKKNKNSNSNSKTSTSGPSATTLSQSHPRSTPTPTLTPSSSLSTANTAGVNGDAGLNSLSNPLNLFAKGQTTTASSSTHPLAQTPITLTTSSKTTHLPFLPAPLPPPPAHPPRSGLVRRRSSFPPAGSIDPSGSGDFPFNFGTMPPTPNFEGFDFTTALDGFSSMGETSGTGATGWTPGIGAWDALLNLDHDFKPTPSKLASSYVPTDGLDTSPIPTGRAQSDPPSQMMFAPMQGSAQQNGQWSSRMAQLGSDLAWRTALSSVVEVDGVGAVTLARVLQEIWRRGGGDAVTAQCLWPSIIIALSMSTNQGRIPTPSAQSSMSLQQLYNLSIRHWEPTIFSGLLGAYSSSSSPPLAAVPPAADAFASQHFGPSTPQREADPTQWINLTPSGFSNLLSSNAKASNTFEVGTSDLRRMSLAKTDNGEDQQPRGIDEILATMEDRKEEMERAQIAANLADQAQDLKQETETHISSRSNSTYQLPTPETDGIGSPPNRSVSGGKIAPLGFSPVSMASPFVSAGSVLAIQPSVTQNLPPPPPPNAPAAAPLAAQTKFRPTQLSMPDNAFIPPPPMCMFFNPAFQDLQRGKMGVWQGDLEVRGRGGGKFPVMIVGEENTGHLWQPNLWPETLTYPLAPVSVESCTSSMIPVSHLAREGLVPITMGMVLCNATGSEIAQYVNMVQGLHAEGVGFHLPCQTRLPIVFLPAKFNSEDPLQRLGIAFMGKATSIPALLPPPGRGRPVTAGRNDDKSEAKEPKKKRRRQSAPASASSPLPLPLVGGSGVGGGGGGRGHKRKESTMVGRIEEEVEAKD